MSTYIDIHIVQLVPPSCINRDDTGSPKSARFGGVQRHRVSSQAWKRTTRANFPGLLPAEDLGERTKMGYFRVTDTMIQRRPELTFDEALPCARKVFETAGFKEDKKHPNQTAAAIFLSRQEIERLTDFAIAFLDGETEPTKKTVRAALLGNKAADVALFGRMLADAPELNIDAACQVHHALSIHKATTEFDYFTAVDDNAPEDNVGAGMIGTVEFVSSALYRYATINVDRLVSNLGDAEAAAAAARAFVEAFTLSMPTGRQNTFANRTRPDFVWVEVREDQPVNWMNAFENPVPNEGQAVPLGVERMIRHAVDEDAAYGTTPVASQYLANPRAVTDTAKGLLEGRSTATTLDGLAKLAGQSVLDAQSEA